MARARRRTSRLLRGARRVTLAAQNALEITRAGRLTAPYSASFDVLHEDPRYRLRRYRGARITRNDTSAPILLVPPLMVASEIYDIAPDASAVGALVRDGIDVWLTDFGAPEHEEGGMQRTLDDHICAVSDAIDHVRRATGRDVHLTGYSQGGMFAYQAAALRRSAGIASVITFGSPVDIHRSVHGVSDAIIERVVSGLRLALGYPLDHVSGLPKLLTANGFKLLSMRQEAQQLLDFLAKLHDRQALEKREAKRLFLRGHGFVAWPGPAFRSFVDQFVVANRMATGGFVIDGRTVSLADIHCPILCFVGDRDEMARPAAVRAIRTAAPDAEVFEARIKAGHFGLVVGRAALTTSWPTVIQWIRWRDGDTPTPPALVEPSPAPVASPAEHDPEAEEVADDQAFDVELAVEVVGHAANALWHRIGDASQDISNSLDHLRFQIPRLTRLRHLEPSSRLSFGRELAEQARAIPHETFFMWSGRAFSYAETNKRVDNIVRGLVACGIRPSQRVGLLMASRPSYLTALVALNRLGAVPVLLQPRMADECLRQALAQADAGVVVADPDHAERAVHHLRLPVYALGGGGTKRPLPPDAIDLEAIDPDAVRMPGWYVPNPGVARDLSMIIASPGASDKPRLLHITNHRWAISAIGAAAACTLTSRDTVYACLPLHHAAGTMVAAGSALVGGARLALAAELSPNAFWQEVRRYGVTVVIYAGEMCRTLVDAPSVRSEHSHPVRLFAGSGMRRDVWERVVDRFGPVGVLELYAPTEATAALANASGTKVGSLGRPIPGSSELRLAHFDFISGDIQPVTAATDHPGALFIRADPDQCNPRIVRDYFEPGDAWYQTGDLVRQDPAGDYWYVDRIDDLIHTVSGMVSPRAIEDALYGVPGVTAAVAYPVPAPSGTGELPVAAITVRQDRELTAEQLTDAVRSLPPAAHPCMIRIERALPMTDGFRPTPTDLKAQGLQPDTMRAYALRGGRYVSRSDSNNSK